MPSIPNINSGAATLSRLPLDIDHPVRAQAQAATVLDAGPHPSVADLNAGASRMRGALHGLEEPPTPDVTDANRLWNDLGRVDTDQISADISMFLAVFAEFAQQMRSAARMQRHAETQAQMDALRSSADEMRRAATARFAAALSQAGAQMMGSLTQIGFSASATSKAVQGATHDDVAAKASPPQVSFEGKKLAARANAHSSYGQAATGLAGAAGGLIASPLNQQADEAEAAKANRDAAAKLHDAAVQDEEADMRQLLDVIRDIREKLAAIAQADTATNQAIARNY